MTTHVLVPRRSARLARPLGAGLFGDFDRLFDEFWGSPGSAVSRAVTPAALAPRMDYSETDDAIRLRAEMPGLDEKDIDVSLEEGVLTIKGEHAEERDEKDEEKGRGRGGGRLQERHPHRNAPEAPRGEARGALDPGQHELERLMHGAGGGAVPPGPPLTSGTT
jgi:HSP20 family molecular chaperone IbpA